MKTYKIIFHGKFRPDLTLAQATANLANLLNAGIDDISCLFNGDEHVLKDLMTQQEAPPYQAELLQAGLLCEIVENEAQQKLEIVSEPEDLGFALEIASTQGGLSEPLATPIKKSSLETPINTADSESKDQDDISGNRCTVSFSGALLPGFTSAQAMGLFARFAQESIAQAETRFDGHTHILKSNLTSTEANQYVAQLANCGLFVDVECRYVRSASETEALTATETTEAESAVPIADQLSLVEPVRTSEMLSQEIQQRLQNNNYSKDRQRIYQNQLQSMDDNPALPLGFQMDDTLAYEYQEVNLIDFGGRLGTLYFLAMNLPLLIMLVLVFITHQFFMMSVPLTNDGTLQSDVLIMSLSIWAVKIFLLFFKSSLYTRRFHDLNLPAYYLLPLLIIDLIIMETATGMTLNAVVLLIIAFIPGRREDNNFGCPSPPSPIPIRILAGVCIVIAIMMMTIIPARIMKLSKPLPKSPYSHTIHTTSSPA